MPPEPSEARTPGKKRILFVTHTYGYGGTELHSIRLIGSFDASSIQAIIVCLGDDPYTRLLGPDSPARVCKVPPPNGFRGHWALIREFRPDIAVFVSGWHGLYPLAAYLAARLSLVRRICTIEHSTAERRSPWPKTWLDPRSVFRWVAGWHARTTVTNALIGLISDQTICVSEHSRIRLVREYAYPLRKTSTVLHGVEASRYPYPPKMRPAVRQALGIRDDESLVAFVGRLHNDKGPDVLLEALCMRQPWPPYKCIVVGDGPLAGELRAFVTRNGLSSRVTFLGFQEDVRPYLAAADIFVLPSRTEAGPPFSLLEAMSSGLACLAADVGGVRELISDGLDGLVVAPESATELGEAMRELLLNPALRSAMGRRAQDRIQSSFNETRSLAEMRALVLGSERAGGLGSRSAVVGGEPANWRR